MVYGSGGGRNSMDLSTLSSASLNPPENTLERFSSFLSPIKKSSPIQMVVRENRC